MEWWQGLALGILQGLTEFLPISSSGHLALLQHFFHLNLSAEETLTFDIFLHLGTLLALFHFYRRELMTLIKAPFGQSEKEEPVLKSMSVSPWKLIGFLILGTLPAVAVGLSMKDTIETQFGDMRSIGIQFIITAFILLSILWIGKKANAAHAPLSWWRSLGIGVAQAFAILPSISRSGSTVAAGMWLKMSPEAATHYSFLLSIPAILGATVLSVADVSSLSVLLLPAAWWGLLASAIVGWLCLVAFLKIIQKGKLHLFAYYCLVLGVVSLVFWK